ncbi:discoidin domain-containing protein [Cohnella fermenti]|uniref:F5/8 type C domain-containing protein n=1 Tax=Cohnella fermenti TaxID=2565925 RepID=A0A4S4BZX4_9BACL|nr:discoidin domain-containing protein [Cohnella fermenti]THF80753.1 hypothetical protein E6C55_09720 [Cohnella fermenti]
MTIGSDTTLKAIAVDENGIESPLTVQYYRFSDNRVLNRSYASSSEYSLSQAPEYAFDGSASTNWQAADGQRFNQWLEVDFGSATSFNKVSLSEYGNRVTSYRIEYWDGASWQTAYAGATIGANSAVAKEVFFPEVTGSKARLYIVSATLQPIIYEFGIYDVPADLEAIGGHGSVALSWEPVTGADHYRVERSPRSGGPYRALATSVVSSVYEDAGAANKTIYYYRVTAIDSAGGRIGQSAEASATTLPALSLAADGTYASSSQFNAGQSADKAFDGLNGTNWQAAVGTGAGQWLEVAFGQATTFNKAVLSEYGNRTTGFRVEYWDGGLWRTAYTGTVIGANASSPLAVEFPEVTGSKARLIFTSTTSQPIIYEFQLYYVPSGLEASGGPNRVDIAWQPVEGALSYRVRRSLYPQGGFSIIASEATSTNYRDTGLLDGAVYSYSVSAVFASGEGELSEIVSAATDGPLNLAYGRTYSSSSDFGATQSAELAFDGSERTNWQAAAGQFAGEWLEVDWGTNLTFNKAVISEYGNRTTGFRIEVWNGASWQTAYTGTTIGPAASSPLTVTFAAVTGSKARLIFTGGSSQPIIYEFGLYST